MSGRWHQRITSPEKTDLDFPSAGLFLPPEELGAVLRVILCPRKPVLLSSEGWNLQPRFWPPHRPGTLGLTSFSLCASWGHLLAPKPGPLAFLECLGVWEVGSEPPSLPCPLQPPVYPAMPVCCTEPVNCLYPFIMPSCPSTQPHHSPLDNGHCLNCRMKSREDQVRP